MAAHEQDGRGGIGGLLRDLAEGSATLVRSEVKLAQVELAHAAQGLARGVAEVALGGVLALLGALSFLTGIVLVLGDQWLPRDLYWLAALIVAVICGIVVAVAVRKGKALLRPADAVPETVATLSEDKEWLNRQLTSGATSR